MSTETVKLREALKGLSDPEGNTWDSVFEAVDAIDARFKELERHAELALIACNAGDLESTKQALTDALAG